MKNTQSKIISDIHLLAELVGRQVVLIWQLVQLMGRRQVVLVGRHVVLTGRLVVLVG